MILSLILIGTSGYTYPWNKGKSNKFEWYLDQGFNSVEINGSFYRFPTENWINNWNVKTRRNFRFSIKVNRSITHYTRLKGSKSVNLWTKFKKSLEPIEEKISFYLFQMPSSFKYTQENLDRLTTFKKKVNLDSKVIVEFRDASWWKKTFIAQLENIKISICSVDAPLLPKKIFNLNNTIYLRLHASKSWYNYLYSEKEIKKIMDKVEKKTANKKAIYLNNDHGMLPNGKYLMKYLLN